MIASSAISRRELLARSGTGFGLLGLVGVLGDAGCLRAAAPVRNPLDVVESLCDRACLLVRGRLEAEGHPSAVVKRYREQLATWEHLAAGAAHRVPPGR